MTQEEFTDAVAFGSYIFAAYAVGIKVVLLYYYLSDWRTLMPRILIGLSHITLMILTVMSLNFRIFLGGDSRFYGSIAASFAFIVAAVGLTLMVRRESSAQILTVAYPPRRKTGEYRKP